MLQSAPDLATLRANFRWAIPERFSIAESCCDRHHPEALALIEVNADGAAREWSFGELRRDSCKLARVLQAQGVGRGDRVGVFLGQGAWTLLTHLAISRLGAVSLPLFRLFGPDALEHRLSDCAAACVITDGQGAAKIAQVRDRLPNLAAVLCVDGSGEDSRALAPLMERASDAPFRADTLAEDPAILIYTSGTTGNPKGALHANRVLLGHLPGVQTPHEFFPQPGDRFWTPADWAWIGGLLDVLLPSLHFGVPVVAAAPAKFDPEAAVRLMAEHGVRNAFLPPTSLKMMRAAEVDAQKLGANLRSIGSGGESLGEELLDWARGSFGVVVNEFYGQTECNLVVSNLASLAAPKPGWMGWPVPGHGVAVLGEDGGLAPAGEIGRIAVKAPDPVMFLGYWGNEAATRAKFLDTDHGRYLLSGDLGERDDDGRLRYVARDDDLITSAGYRIGPAEVEAAVARHPGVAACAVVGWPDDLRGQIVKAYVVPKHPACGQRDADPAAQAELRADIEAWVANRLAAHERPRSVEFVDELPLTATGKVMRRALRHDGREAAADSGKA